MLGLLPTQTLNNLLHVPAALLHQSRGILSHFLNNRIFIHLSYLLIRRLEQ